MSSAVNDMFQGDQSVALIDQIGTMAKRLEDIAEDMGKAKTEDTARFHALKEESEKIAADLTVLKTKHDNELVEAEHKAAHERAKAWIEQAANTRTPHKAIGSAKADSAPLPERGDFLAAVFMANHRDAQVQAEGKAKLAELGYGRPNETVAASLTATWDAANGKATLGTTDATGGWLIPPAVVDEFIKPAQFTNIYRELMTVISGVTTSTIEMPFRAAGPARATVVAWGDTKENSNLAYNGYTATMYTIARIYDIANQFLRHSRGAAEADVMSELASAFALGEAYYIREGSGTSEPFGYTSALNNAPPAFRSAFTASATTLAGSIAKSIATATGALAGRGVTPTAAVLSAASYWNMASQGTDTAGFFLSPLNGPLGIRPFTLLSPWGLPVYPDAGADATGTAAVTDNLVVADWKAFKVYFGDGYRVDSSDQAGTRWDTNLTGFRGEEEMAFDARPAVYAGFAQQIQDIEP